MWEYTLVIVNVSQVNADWPYIFIVV